MNKTSTDTEFETEIAELLSELSSVQDELLEVLTAKRDLMAESDVEGMARLQPREERLIEEVSTLARVPLRGLGRSEEPTRGLDLAREAEVVLAPESRVTEHSAHAVAAVRDQPVGAKRSV